MQCAKMLCGFLFVAASGMLPSVSSQAMVPPVSKHSFALPLIAEQDLPVRCVEAVKLLSTLNASEGEWRVEARCEGVKGVKGERLLRARLVSSLKTKGGKFLPLSLQSKSSRQEQARIAEILRLLQKFESPVVLQLSSNATRLHARGWIWVAQPTGG